MARFKGKDVEDDPKSLRVPISAVGLLLVIAGVAGETICESRVSTFETSLRTHESQLLANAETNSGQAQINASRAEQKAAQIGKDADELKKEAEDAKRDMVKAQLELARLTSPIQSVPVVDGIAAPDPTKGLRLRILLHTDVRIKLPTLSKGKAVTWTLFIVQDEKGNHQFSTFPKNVMFGNFLTAPPHSFCNMELVSDEYGTTDTTFGAASCPTNQSDPIKK